MCVCVLDSSQKYKSKEKEFGDHTDTHVLSVTGVFMLAFSQIITKVKYHKKKIFGIMPTPVLSVVGVFVMGPGQHGILCES